VNRVAEEDEEELEELRRRKLLALQQKVSDEQRQAQIEQQVELQKQELLKKILTPEARQRLTNLRMVRPEFTDQLELQLIQLAQQRKLPIPLSDEQLKQILAQLQAQKRETKIRRI
jgi:programmed cell death protein 5